MYPLPYEFAAIFLTTDDGQGDGLKIRCAAVLGSRSEAEQVYAGVLASPILRTKSLATFSLAAGFTIHDEMLVDGNFYLAGRLSEKFVQAAHFAMIVALQHWVAEIFCAAEYGVFRWATTEKLIGQAALYPLAIGIVTGACDAPPAAAGAAGEEPSARRLFGRE